jgi:hypothetical protein
VIWLIMLLTLCGVGGCNVLIGSGNTVIEKGIEADTTIKKASGEAGPKVLPEK